MSKQVLNTDQNQKKLDVDMNNLGIRDFLHVEGLDLSKICSNNEQRGK